MIIPLSLVHSYPGKWPQVSLRESWRKINSTNLGEESEVLPQGDSASPSFKALALSLGSSENRLIVLLVKMGSCGAVRKESQRAHAWEKLKHSGQISGGEKEMICSLGCRVGRFPQQLLQIPGNPSYIF